MLKYKQVLMKMIGIMLIPSMISPTSTNVGQIHVFLVAKKVVNMKYYY